MKILAILIVLGLIHKCSNTNNMSIQGEWASVEDEHYIVKFTADKFYEIYNKDTSFYNYSRSSKSCDENYLKKEDKSLDFIKVNDGRCFEITGLSDTILAYRYTISGKIQIFHKTKATH
jgi:hypothetical protein